MTIALVGISHRTARFDVLERATAAASLAPCALGRQWPSRSRPHVQPR